MKQTIAKIVRIASLSPFTAAVTLVIMYASGIVTHYTQLIATLCCLTVLPILSYPLHLAVPKLRAKGRDGERSLAIIFSVVGYAIITVLCFALGYPAKLTAFVLTYLVSGAILFVCRLFGVRPSGHCCGVSGPIAYLIAFVSPWYAFAALLLVPVAWSCLSLKRHTLLQCVIGAAISVVALGISALILL